jgi:DNA-binding Lrp family transcriptional regulator
MTAIVTIPKTHSSQDDFPSFPDIQEFPEFIPHCQFRNFIIIPTGMVTQKNLPRSAITLYGILSRYSDKDGLCYPSQKTLAADLGVSLRQVRNLINSLEESNYIRRHVLSGDDNRVYFIFHNFIPLNWKEEILKKEQQIEKKEAEQIQIQKGEQRQIQQEKKKRELYSKASDQWNSLDQKEKQIWFDRAKLKQEKQVQKGLPVFRKNKTQHLWFTARIMFVDRVSIVHESPLVYYQR